MANTDMVICRYVSGSCECKDYWSTGQVTPTLDTDNDINTLTNECTRDASSN